MNWWGRLFHRHEWQDGYVFDSCIQVTIGTGERRVLGQAVMMFCTQCPAMRRRPLKTWDEARLARRRISALDREAASPASGHLHRLDAINPSPQPRIAPDPEPSGAVEP